MRALKNCIRTVSNSIHVDESNCAPTTISIPICNGVDVKNCREISRDGRLVEYPFKESFFGSKMQKVHAVVIILHQRLHNYQNCHRLHLFPSSCDQAAEQHICYFAATTIVHRSQSFFKCKTHLKLEALNYDSPASLRVCRAGRDKVSRWVM